MCQHNCPRCSPEFTEGMSPGESRKLENFDFLSMTADALTTPYHLVPVSPARRRVVEIGDILLGRPGDGSRPIIIWEPVGDRMTWWDSAEKVLELRQERDNANQWELEALKQIFMDALPRVRFAESE